MRAEQDIRLRDKARKAHIVVEFLVGMDYVELRHVIALEAAKPRGIRNLLEGRGNVSVLNY